MTAQNVNADELGFMIDEHYNSKIPLFIYGGFGIGKSSIVEQQTKKLATKKGREFISWNKTTHEQRDELFNNPQKYFILFDIRLSQNDNTDLKGLPKFDSSESVEWAIPKWINYLTHKDADGIVFLDELNLAPPMVQASAYQLLHDRCVGESSLSPNISFISAGNRASDKAHIFDMPNPLKDRMSEVELDFESGKWFDWAYQAGLDTRVITYLTHKTSSLYKVNKGNLNKDAKPVTPRGWERVSRLIKDKRYNRNMRLLVGSTIGSGMSAEFMAYLKIHKQLDIDKILNNPDEVLNIKEQDVRYSLVGALADRVSNKPGKDIFGKVSAVYIKLQPEFAILGLKLIRGMISINKFKTLALNDVHAKGILKKNAKYFLS